ncbi:unnamed protein product, partial [Phaeothamnion confervicola]
LNGHYRFRGNIDWHGSQREIRLGTSQREPDGKVRYKASVRAPQNGNLYVLDGVLSELSPAGRHTGTLTAKLPLANIIPASAQGRRAGAGGGRNADMIELTAAVEGDIDGVRVDNMAFSFEHDGKPQLLSGASSANWRHGLRMETRLASRWLDLDQIAGMAPQASPLQLIRHLIGQVSAVLPPDGSSLLTVDVDQVNLGGTPLSGVRLALARAGGLTSIGELRATLPGNSRAELRGTLGAVQGGGSTGQDTFDGEIVLRGGSYQRFGAWAGAGGLIGQEEAKQSGRADAPFSLTSKLRLQPERVMLSNTSLELAGRHAAASLDWNWGQQRRLDVVAEGNAIDVRSFAPGLLNLTSEPGTPAADKARQTGFPLLARLADRIEAVNRAVGDMKLQLRTGELTDGATTLRDVEADVTVGAGRLTIATLRVGSPANGHIELQGEIKSLDSKLASKPQASLRGWLSADNAAAVADLAGLLPSSGRSASRNWLQNANHLDTSFTLELGARPDDRLTLAAVGAIDGIEHDVELKLDGGLTGWRQAPITLRMTLDGPASSSTIRGMMLPGSAQAVPATLAKPEAARPARLQIDAAGATAESIVASARLELASTATVTYQGRSSISEDGGVDLSGTLNLAAPNTAAFVAFVTGGPVPQIPAAVTAGTVSVERKWGTTSLASRNLEIGASRVAGQATIARSGERTRIDANLTASLLDLPSLMGLVLDGA